MAAAAAASSSPPDHRNCSYSGEWEYDVFLCFRGGDTRHGFTSHLMAALSDKKIKAFIDTMLRKTESIDELLSVLRRSALSIVIFSEKFADSPWCLDEVATIVQSMEKFGHRALPVFYKVRWSDVAGDSGCYSAIIDGELKASSEDNKRWRDALKTVANCAGHTSTAVRIESELIKAIVEDVQKLLIDMSPSIKSENLVGMGSRVREVEQLLAMDEVDDTRIVGLWGMGGVGKTTLAKACYERVVSSMKDIKHHFIRNINQIYEKQHEFDGMVHELYSKVLSESNLSREDLDIHYRRARLSHSKVFIVLDDVDTPCQLEKLLLGDVFNITKLFDAGSRIIVTTRNKKVLQNAMAKTYNVTCLSGDESVQLFSLRAFRKHIPPDSWMDLSRRATSCCNGNPLALRVLGGTLFGEDKDYWESVLSGLRLVLNPNIGDILRRSYNKLGADEKRLFLDVACFFHGILRSRLIGYMATLHPAAHAQVKDLIDKSILTCISSKDGDKIEVHGLFKELAMNIVNEEPKLGKRSRLVDPDDIHKLLTTTKVKYWTTFFIKPLFKSIEMMMMVLPRRKRRKVLDTHCKRNCVLEGLRATEGISLDLDRVEEMYLEANAFEGMDSLTFLKIWWRFAPFSENKGISKMDIDKKKKIHLPYYGLDSLPDKLRWLHWDGYPLKSLPFRFYPQHLIHLTIRWSLIKKCWEGFDQPELVNLMVLDLSYCINLTAIPDLSRSLQLEELILRGCRSIAEVPSHVQYLDKLKMLDLGNCVNLERLPSKLNSKLIIDVQMNNCPKVRHCPEFNSGELMELNLDETPISELPNAIYCLKQGGRLSLFGKSITKFPAISTTLGYLLVSRTAVKEMNSYDYHQASSPKFSALNLDGNSQLKCLPKNMWNMVSFKLSISGSPLLESLPDISEPVNGFSTLRISECEGFKSIPSSINNLISLQFLDLTNTGIQSLPSSIEELHQLSSIRLNNCRNLESIPSNIHKLPNLDQLELRGCRSIRSLPELPSSLSRIDVSCCKSLQALPSNISKLSWESLSFYNCPQLDRTIPDETVANYPVHAMLSLRSEGYKLVYSGSEIPEWFTYKSANDASCLTAQLPPANCTSSNQAIKGIAFGMVCSCDASDADYLNIKCYGKVGNWFFSWTFATWTTDCLPSGAWDGKNSSSDQVMLWIDMGLCSELCMEWQELSRRETDEGRGEGDEEALRDVECAGRGTSFRFYPHLLNGGDVRRLKNFKIKRCGISLLF